MVIAYAAGLGDYLTFENLKKNQEYLKGLVDAHPILMPLVYILIYFVATAISFPGAAFLTIFGGFLFPMPLSTLYVVIAATAGATAIFLAAKTSLGDLLRRKGGRVMEKMEGGFRKNAVSYMFFLRFIPLFPFWMVNLAPAFFGVPLVTYVWTTFVGIIPGSFVYTQAGRGLSEIFASGESFSVKTVLNTEMKIALIVLAIFALIPPLVKRIRRKDDQG